MVLSKLPVNLRKTISRRALFGSGILSLAALNLHAKPANAEVSLSVGALFSLAGNSADLGTQSKLMMEIAAGDLEALLGRHRCPSRDIWLHRAQVDHHSETLPVPTRQNSRFWMSATSRTVIVRGVPNGGSVRFGEDVERLDIA